MRRRLILLLALLLTVTALVVPAKPVKACDWCMVITCDQANQTCEAQADAIFTSCMILGGTGAQCVSDAVRYYRGCMTAHGCPVN